LNDLNNSDVEIVCRELLSSFQGLLSWKWDGRFGTVLAECGVDNQDSVRTALGRHLGVTWDSSSIATAPDIVRTINIRVANLRSGQLLFTSDPNPGAVVFCAWWPWDNGKTVSLRMAPFYKKLADSEYAKKIQLFKSWFEV